MGHSVLKHKSVNNLHNCWNVLYFGTRSRHLTRAKYLHPTEYCGMQLLIPAWDTSFWQQSPQMVQHQAENVTTETVANIMRHITKVLAECAPICKSKIWFIQGNNHHHCLLNRLFRHRSNKTSKLRVTGLCAGNSPVTGEFPAQMASNAENVSIWWRHHVLWVCFWKRDKMVTGWEGVATINGYLKVVYTIA